MQAIIVAAGQGKRLGFLGQKLPKGMLTVQGKPLLHYQFQALREAGIKKVTIVTGHLAEKIPQEWEDLEIRLVHNPDYKETGGGYSFLLGSIGIAEDLIYLVSDILYSSTFIKRLAQCKDFITLAVQLRPTMPDDMKVAIRQKGVEAVGKKLAQADGTFVGMAFLPGRQMAKIRTQFQSVLEEQACKKYHFGNTINTLIEKGQTVQWLDCIDLPWYEVDSIHDLRRARSQWKGNLP